MTPRLLVVCLGGLAGAGALVCCDMGDVLADEDAETLETVAEDGGADDVPADGAEAAEAEPAQVH